MVEAINQKIVNLLVTVVKNIQPLVQRKKADMQVLEKLGITIHGATNSEYITRRESSQNIKS